MIQSIEHSESSSQDQIEQSNMMSEAMQKQAEIAAEAQIEKGHVSHLIALYRRKIDLKMAEAKREKELRNRFTKVAEQPAPPQVTPTTPVPPTPNPPVIPSTVLSVICSSNGIKSYDGFMSLVEQNQKISQVLIHPNTFGFKYGFYKRLSRCIKNRFYLGHGVKLTSIRKYQDFYKFNEEVEGEEPEWSMESGGSSTIHDWFSTRSSTGVAAGGETTAADQAVEPDPPSIELLVQESCSKEEVSTSETTEMAQPSQDVAPSEATSSEAQAVIRTPPVVQEARGWFQRMMDFFCCGVGEQQIEEEEFVE